MLLEDLLEQEKREKQERERQASMNNDMTNPNSSNTLLSDHDFERLRADVLGNSGMPAQSMQAQGMQTQGMAGQGMPAQGMPNQVMPTQGIPAQGLLPIQQQQQQPMMQNQAQQRQAFVAQNQPRPQFIQRQVSQQQQPHQAPQQHMQNQVQTMNTVMEPTVVKTEACSVPMYVPNLQKPPQLPPDNIVTDQDRQQQMNYEQWLREQDNKLAGQRKYYETEVSKLRKSRKALNSKQRALKKGGNDLTETDTIELNKITADQTFVQKQLENARKQSRQHALVMADYNNKQQQANMKNNLARQQMAVSNAILK